MKQLSEDPLGRVNRYLDRDDVMGATRAAFTARDPQYAKRCNDFKTRLDPLAAAVATLQADGHAMGCGERAAKSKACSADA